ncbi:MAG TPA: cobalt-precorrin-5B (C(1))-methyltransferase CbiD [Dissulfurispiraceae bacterium]|nr:cobalt-precorrin-5B (C(1))-methyltransferase CbiD [Dissulfurispiraceae bacterium]
MRRRGLRSGYTTGACAAAAARAAVQLLMEMRSAMPQHAAPFQVSIPFPDGSRAAFKVHRWGKRDDACFASVIKDAGDDPDVTNGAEIIANARFILQGEADGISIRGGNGVGTATKPGLAIQVGAPAINPVPQRMIFEAASEAICEGDTFCNQTLRTPDSHRSIEITISVTDGESLAKKTLNERLGIVGGISILGTTGIVKPLSAEAWTATISASMDVAKACGLSAIVLSAGRASENAHIRKYCLPEESYVMMGDYLEFSLREAAARRFSKIQVCAQWAKMLKIAMATPQTHVRHGAIDILKAVDFLESLGIGLPKHIAFNTAREIFDCLMSGALDHKSALTKVCNAAKSYASDIADPVHLSAVLVSYGGEIIACSL